MKEPVSSFEEDRQLIVDLFLEVIAPNEKLYEFLEDDQLTWIDDIPLVNTHIMKQLKAMKPIMDDFYVPKVYKDNEDKAFVKDLFRKTILRGRAGKGVC
jgi:N utilization substance protein B